MTSAELTYEGLSIPSDALHEARMDIYHSTGSGFHIFRGFLSPASAAHIAGLWAELPVSISAPRPNPKKKIPAGYPNFGEGDEHLRVWTSFFWNAPMDELTYDAALQVQRLRNRIEGRKPFNELMPFGPRALGFRVVVTVRGGAVNAHRDWVGADYDPARTQATLFLAEKGSDYDSGGFFFETNRGETIELTREVKSGDLVIWRYGNVHRVDAVESSAPQLGFVRMLFPNEEIEPRPFRLSAPSVARAAISNRAIPALRSRVRTSEFAQRRLIPVYRSLRSRR